MRSRAAPGQEVGVGLWTFQSDPDCSSGGDQQVLEGQKTDDDVTDAVSLRGTR